MATTATASRARADLPLWEQLYRHAFPTFATLYAIRRDGWAQRGGIDRLVILESGKTLWIEEKLREQDYPDILLEYYSDYPCSLPFRLFRTPSPKDRKKIQKCLGLRPGALFLCPVFAFPLVR